MRFSLAASLILLPFSVSGVNIISSNDDGWAEINIRTLYDSLTNAGHSVLLSAPALNMSGNGSKDAPPKPLDQPCEFNSCPAGSPGIGSNSSQPHFNYVNSYPVTAIKHGINILAPKFFKNKTVDLAVTGPNAGSNIGLVVPFSATVGSATYAASNASIPTISFSGAQMSQIGWNVKAPSYSLIYADLATNVTHQLIASGKPYLPRGTWLNVNFPKSTNSTCSKAEDFKFIFSRIHPAVPGVTPDDVERCGSKHLPTETSVVFTPGCFASVSVGFAANKSDVSSAAQKVVQDKLGGLFSCLP